ncbi:hypothetical protein VTJ04DRAFT_9243 [Mycothermus thermophilus]|uniref:uncharacterized protein n=1 Tax=Humicola insolens TaxID=85995 RepID=UPI0037431EB3
MAAWPGPAAGEAVALARAVEVVMNTLVGTAIKDEVVTWSLPAIDSSGIIRPDSVTFRIEKIDGRWRAFADELDAALSLWLYSVKDVIPTKPKGSAKGDEWLRTKETLDRASLRLLGQRTEALIRDLQWWAPEIASRVIDVEPADQETDGNTTPWELGNHRVVGFVSDTKGSYVRKIGHNLWEQHHVYKPRSSESPIERSLLAVESRLPLGVLYSQHMFTAFMWSTAKTMKAPIQGETDLQSVQQGSEGGDTAWQRFTLHDTQLSKIAREIQDTGLASLDDVYLSIIPPLSVANKLPDPSPIIDVVRARAMPFEESHRWENAAEVYLWLFRQTKSLSEDSYVRTKATALLAEYHKSLTFAVAMNAAFDPSSYETMSTSEVKNQVRKELLEGAVRDVLKDINGLYMLQGSPYGSGLSDSAEPGLVDYTTLLKLYTNRNHGLLQEDINRFSNPIQGECLLQSLV